MIDDPRDPDEIEDEVETEGEDAGRDDDEGGDEAQAGQEPEDAEAQEGQVDRQPTRGEKRFAKLSQAAREANEQAAALRREIDELRANQRREQSRTQEETPEQEQARLSLMTAEERFDYKLDKAQKANARQMAVMQFESADRSDKAVYDTRAVSEPRYKKYADEVEKLLAEERRKGNNWPRETILKFVLGAKVLASGGATAQQRQQGQRRIERQRTAPESGRSDRAVTRGRAGSGNSLADLEARLEGVNI